MQNEELLLELSRRIANGTLDRKTVVERFGIKIDTISNATAPSVLQQKPASRFSLTKMLYILGGAVVVLGIFFLMAQIWEDIGSFGRIFVTLILGFVFAGIGSYFFISKPEAQLGYVFHIIAGLIIPGGAVVTVYEMFEFASAWPSTIAFGALFLFYLALYLVHKNAVLTFFAIANGTTFIYLLTEAMLDTPFYRNGDIYAYLTMAVGISYILLAHAFQNTSGKALVGLLNFLGSIAFFGAAFSRVFDSDAWELLFFVLTILGIAFAIYKKSRSILVVSTTFLVFHFIYITNEYFADSIGWPISLVILGFVIIGLGYVSINLNKKFISGPSNS